MVNQAIEYLLQEAPPPIKPLDVGHDWAVAESRLGIQLPGDYKAIVSKYGRGIFDPLKLVIWNLHVVIPDVDKWLKLEQFAKNNIDESLYLTALAESPGLFPWGHGIQSVLYWAMSGRPDEWHVVVSTDEHTKFHEFKQFNTSQFLYELIVAKNAIVTEIWSADCVLPIQEFYSADDVVEGVLKHVP